MPRRLLFILLFLLSKGIMAQDKSNRGKEFWLAYGFDYTFFNETPVNSQDLAIYISTEQQAATVVVTITNTGYSQTLNIPANTVDASIILPKSGANDARTLTDGLQTRDIHIVSDVPVAVYAHVYATQVSGATMLMPVDTYGYKYYSINYYQTTSQSSPNDWYSWFYAIASEDNTRLEITPSDTTKNGWLPGQTYTVNLNKGESYHVFGKATFNGNAAYASKDMTGSKILSVAGADGKCHPIGVFSGSGGIRLCRGDGGEFMHQQVFPAQAWGTRYLTYHTINNTASDINETNRNYYRVCVQDPTSVVKRNGVVLTGIIKNFFYEFLDSTGGDYITSDKPIMVAQYTPNKSQCWNIPTSSPSPPVYGDPEMFYLSPIEQGQKSVLFYTSRKSGIDYVYANIHLPTTAIGSLLVDGSPVPAANIKAHPNLPGYSVALTRFIGAAAQHRITCDSTFTSTVYGLGNYESYGYNVGTFVNNLNALTNIANTLNNNGKTDTFTCPKTPTRLVVKVAYRATSMNWLLSQAGGGLAPNTDSLIINPVPIDSNQVNGRRYYTYTLQQDFTFTTPGTYYIPVIYTSPDIDNCNHTDTARIQIIVKPGPVSDFSFNPVLCVQDTAFFTGKAIPGIFNIDRYLWTFDDNTTANTKDTKKRFATAGNHDIKYRIIADNGCIADTVKTLSFLGSPMAKFGFDKNICVGDSIKFSDSSTIAVGTIASWKWNFGDGNTATYTNANPFYHRYTVAGNYTVSLVATSASGCNSDTFKLPVQVNFKPVAKFGVLINNICLGDSIKLIDSSTIGAGSITGWSWNFGDGTTAFKTNDNPFFHQYALPGSYTVSLVVSPTSGCVSDTFKLSVSVGVKPLSKFGVSNNSLCQGDSIKISDSSTIASGTITSWRWSFGDGQTVVNTNANPFYHRYTVAGNYTITLVTVPAVGCIGDTFKMNISVSFKPVSKFGILVSNICLGDSIKLSDSSSIGQGAITGWRWNFGDGSSVVNTNATPFYHPYALPGSYTVSLVVSAGSGCLSDTFKLPVSVGVKPVAKFGISSNNGCQRDSIKISDSSTVASGTIASWKWNFGDGITATNTNGNPFFHTYNLPGTYTISLVTIPAVGCNSDTFKTTVTINPKPKAKFGFDRNICISDSIRFSDSSTIATGSIVSWKWDFGDGNTIIKTNGSPFFHQYNVAGTFVVSLVTIPSAGCTDTFKLSVTVNYKPVSKFGLNNSNLCLGDSVKISDSSSIASGNISSWKWNFGDGITATFTNGNPFYHKYALPGNYVISLVASPSTGCSSDTFKLPVSVSNKPVAKFGFDRNICVADSIKFSDSSSIAGGTITSWEWNFGDGSTVILNNKNPFFHTYTVAGTYTVSLVVTPALGCKSDTFKLSVTVAQKPTASFTVSGAACKDSTLVFTPTSVSNGGTLQSWYWSFGNGQTLNATNGNPVSVTYNSVSNNMVVKHVAGISSGCISDTAVLQPLVIHQNPSIDFTITGDTLCQNVALQFKSITNPADSLNRWAWSFGDGTFGSADSLSKSYSQPGAYNVQLIAKNKFGCGSLPVSKPVTINLSPVVDAGPSFAVFSGTTIRFNPTVNDSLLFAFRWSPSFTGISHPDSLRPTLVVLQTQTYTLTASGPGNCIASDTMQVRVLSALKIVNAFSPNGDGINDVWILPGLEDYLQATVQIFDRYGRVVYNSTGYPKPWDGKLNGSPLPVGTYYYIIDTKTDFVKPFTGSVTILK